MAKVEILDCTLRDGGYVNQWKFGYRNITAIMSKLASAGIDYIECGFLNNCKYDKEYSLFSNINQVNKLITKKHALYTVMINFGEFDTDNLPDNTYDNIILRIAFKKWQYEPAIDFCQKLKAKGYRIFINPMHTDEYATDDLIKLAKDANRIHPDALTIVDTTGGMIENTALSIFTVLDKYLDSDISIGFHSHNNLNLSFSNAQALMKQNPLRKLIIDSTVHGIGRGAGNICTEQLVKYLNNPQYKLMPVLEILNKQINPIFINTPWGSSAPYYLAAINHCHPNYAKYINKNLDVEKMNKVFSSIPKSKKRNFDIEIIKELCY